MKIVGEEYAGIRDQVKAAYPKLKKQGIVLTESEFIEHVDKMDRITLVSIYEAFVRGE